MLPRPWMSTVLTLISYRPGKGHTELEEELLETAHIDYERVAIVSRPQHRSGGSVAVWIRCDPPVLRA